MISTKNVKKVGIISEDKVCHYIIPYLSVVKRGTAHFKATENRQPIVRNKYVRIF